uniref:Uncharacterized protein n=1 Tax=Mycobacterium riyadhense TaxID=486698 RepID=A0A653F226_9MYCO|nr:hypothetical protein BIN_B_05265 [Mycobacterium riyadhense]
MGVGARNPKRRYAGPTYAGAGLPGLRLGEQSHLTRAPIHVRRRLIHVQRRRQHAVAHRLDHLDHSGRTGGRLGMAHIGFDRPQPQRPIRITILAVRRQNRLRLNGITQHRAGAMSLNHIHVGGPQPGRGQRQTNHSLLGWTVGSGQPVGSTVLIDRAAPNHRQHLMPIAAGIRKPLQQHQTRALGESGPVGGGGERLAPPIHRQTALTREHHQHGRGSHHGDATGQGHRTLSSTQCLTGLVHRHQRRRTRGINRHRRPF